MVYARHFPVSPGNHDRIPTRFGDSATISGITSPINAGTFLEIWISVTVMALFPLPAVVHMYGKPLIVVFAFLLRKWSCFTSAGGGRLVCLAADRIVLVVLGRY